MHEHAIAGEMFLRYDNYMREMGGSRDGESPI